MPVSSRFWRKMPSKSPTVGKFCTPEKPISLYFAQEELHHAEGIGAADAGQHGVGLDDGQNLAAPSPRRWRWRHRRA